MRQLSALFAAFLAFLVSTAVAQAAAETWVSGDGADQGNCQRKEPCRTFAYAFSKTGINGTINVLSPGSFGPLTITHGVNIVAQGVEALINTVNAGGIHAAIIVQAPNSHVVSLRGLTIVPGVLNTGIVFGSGAALHIDDCTLLNSVAGVLFQPGFQGGAGQPELSISNSTISNSAEAVEVAGDGSAGAKAVIDRLHVDSGRGFGIRFINTHTTGRVTGIVRDSFVSAGSQGITAEGANVMIERTTVTNNSVGILAFGATRIGDSVVTRNQTGLLGTVASYGTNKIDGNDRDIDGTLTPITYK